MKKIPYCISNFERIITKNFIYVDKTRFIELLEKEQSDYYFLIRPRKFGKSLFLSMLEHYYDIRFESKFNELFGELYIGKKPTPNHNKYFVIRFSFSGLNTCSVEEFKDSFATAIRSSIDFFLIDHKEIIADYKEKMKELETFKNVRAYIEFAFKIIKTFDSKAYIIIDEYDHFANDLIAQGTNLSETQYKELIWANGVVRDFYETLKDNSQSVIEKIFITGITPIMLDDVTSGFNISNNLSLKEKYNEILGFTEEEVDFVRKEAGIDKSLINFDIEYLYNGYKFHVDAEKKLYNSSLINYFFLELIDEKGKVERLIDSNIKTDYGRIKMLLNKSENINELEQIIETGEIFTEVIDRFSIELIHEQENFLSLLYYMGLVTIDKEIVNGKPLLKIPNYSIRTMYWEYMKRIIMERNPKMIYKPNIIFDSLGTIAFDNDYKPFFDTFQKNFISQISNLDLEHFSEKNVKFLLLSILFQNSYYLPISELENSKGYTDIYLQRRNYLYPNIKIDWVWELKYIKHSESKDTELIAEKQAEAIEQLQRYKSSNLFKDRTDVRYLMIIFVGKNNYISQEI